MKPVIVIVGPTAVGKSGLALSLAQRYGGEIINADSRQIYRYMDIGTAKPTSEQRALVPHHLLDVVEPAQTFSLALFQPLAYQAIAGVLAKGKLPFLVGGSGLYVWAVVEGWRIPPVPPDPDFRGRMEQWAVREGTWALYHRLVELDPDAARKIDPRNLRRVIRALEVCYQGTPFSRGQHKEPPPWSFLILGLTCQREELYRRIDRRVEDMLARGLIGEVAELLGRGYGLELPAMSGVGYREIGRYLEGRLSLAPAVQEMKFRTHRLARHQYAWFHPGDGRIKWFDIMEQPMERASPLVRDFLSASISQGSTSAMRNSISPLLSGGGQGVRG